LEQFPFDGLAAEWLTWHRDGKHILTGGQYPTQSFIWDVHTGARNGIHMPRFADQGQFLPNGKGFLWGTDYGNVRLFDFALPADHVNSDPRAETADAAPKIELGPMVVPGGHWDRLWGLAVSPDGRFFATGAHDQTVKLWDAEKRELLRTLEGHTELVWSVAFSPDSKLLASTSADDARKVGEIKIWDVATGRELVRLEGHSKLVTAVEFHPSGNWLATASLDGSIIIWDLPQQRAAKRLFQFGRPVYSLAFRPDGQWLAAGSLDRRVGVWNFEKQGLPESNSAASVPLDPSGPLATEPDHWLTDHVTSVYSVGWSPDGRQLATGAEQGIVLLWDGQTFTRLAKLQGDTNQIRHLAWSRDGSLLAAAGYASSLLVWDIKQVRSTLQAMNLDW
jgi:WD40 repeat protein